MFRNPVFSTVVVTCCMLLYQVFSFLQILEIFTAAILLISPLLVLWMVLTILKDKKIRMQELNDDEEWGYADIEKDKLGMF